MKNITGEKIFLVQGSAKEPYKVTFRMRTNGMSASCTCPAGENGQLCKHRLNLLGGMVDGLIGENSQDIETVVSWLSETGVGFALNEVVQAEEQFEIAKRKLATAKKQLLKILHD